MRRFELHRDEDATGVSGTGVVAEGVQFADGTCAMRWLSEHPSTALYDTADDIVRIHGHGGLTRLVWLDALQIRVVFEPGDNAAYLRLLSRRQDIINRLGRPR
jgi:hypothetical protein